MTEKTYRCHFCGSTKDVHYSISVFDPVIADQKSNVCVCKHCAEKLGNIHDPQKITFQISWINNDHLCPDLVFGRR